MAEKLRYACIGAGGIAEKKHLKEYAALPGVELVAVCDANLKAAESLAVKYGIPAVYTDYITMFKEQKLDLVSICTPNFLHAPITMEALRAGVHVHCEKPLALNAAEVAAVLEQKGRSGKRLMVALNNRFTPEAALIKRLAEEGFFGEIYEAKCGWVRNSGIPGIGKWFSEKRLSGGGALIDLGVHFLDLAIHFMGYPKAAAVTGATYNKFGAARSRVRRGYSVAEGGIFDVEDTATGVVRFHNGAMVHFEFSWAANLEEEVKFVEIYGTKGGASLRNGELKLFTQQAGAMFTMIPDAKTIPAVPNESKEFVDSILAGSAAAAPSPAEEAHELMKIIDAIYLSAEERREIRIV